MKIKYKSVSNRINERMQAKGLRHKDLVDRIEVSRGAVTHWLDGTSVPTGERRRKLCELLDITEEYLIEGSGVTEEILMNSLENNENVINSLLNFKENLLNSISVRVVSFDSAINAINYINQINLLRKKGVDTVGVDMNEVEQILNSTEGKYIDIPKDLMESLTDKPENIVTLSTASSLFPSFNGSQTNIFIDYSIDSAKENGYYLIEYGELKGVRQLQVHAITGAIKIMDPLGNGSSESVSVGDFEYPFKISGKAIYVGMPLV